MIFRPFLVFLVWITSAFATLPSYTLLDQPLEKWFQGSTLQYVTLPPYKSCDECRVYPHPHNIKLTWAKDSRREEITYKTHQILQISTLFKEVGIEVENCLGNPTQDFFDEKRTFSFPEEAVLFFKETFILSADPEAPSGLRQVILEKLPGFTSVLIKGNIDFNQPFNPFKAGKGKKYFYTQGAKVTLVFDPEALLDKK